jgi:magnesium-protoporphyrin IX monomethyl ester (oxidative) cyclase
MYGHAQRYRSPENICDEIRALIEKFNIKEIRFDDDTFALNKKFVMSICDEIIRRGYHKKIRWTCFGHISRDDSQMYERMAEAGCFKVDFGVESGSQRVLDSVGKKIDMEKAINTVRICKKAGLDVYCDFMIGFPHEVEEDIKKSMEVAVKLDPDYIQVSYVIPYPGTRMYAQGLKEQYLLYPENWKMYSSCKPLISSGEISPNRIEKYYGLFWKRFYLRPNFIFKAMKRAFSSSHEFKRTWRGFISFSRRFL